MRRLGEWIRAIRTRTIRRNSLRSRTFGLLALDCGWPLAVVLAGWLGVNSASSAEYGLDQRLPIGPFLNRTFPEEFSVVSGSWSTVKAFPKLTFQDPVNLTFAPRSSRLYVCGRQGMIWSFENNPATAEKELVLDIRSRVQGLGLCGLLGMAFHPEFGLAGSPNRGYFYVFYRYSPNPFTGPGFVPVETQGYNRVSRFTIADGASFADPNSELILINQYCRHTWHNGGAMFFGTDGFLYFCTGDEGEGVNIITFSAQRIDRGLFGGVFRIDVDQNPARSHPIRRQPLSASTNLPPSSSANYYIPNDNPFLDPAGGVLEEFYALGFRSPHRMTFDAESGRIWLGDVGAETFEEVDLIQRGRNYQWPDWEGFRDYPFPRFNPFIGIEAPPVYQFHHTNSQNSVIGGYVYRGSEHRTELGGKYLFGDNGSGRIWSMDYDGVNPPRVTYLCNMPPGNYHTGLSSFGVDQNGEVYMCHLGTGQIYKLSSTVVAKPLPKLLSQVGFLSDTKSFQVVDAFVPYRLNVPFWSDGAVKTRWIAVPNDGAPYGPAETVTFSTNGYWTFPSGTVLVKHFELPVDDGNPAVLKRLETRFLIRDTNGYVYGLTYKWRDDGSDADLLSSGLQEDVRIRTAEGRERTQPWYYPSRQECLTCHNAQTKGVLGVTTRQLNCEQVYPLTGRSANQLRTLNHLGLFAPALDEQAIPTMEALLGQGDDPGTLEWRARSYLDANCGHCHNPLVGAAYFDARYQTPIDLQRLINGPFNNSLGLEAPSPISPGSTARSLIHYRMDRLDSLKMPPLGRNVVDSAGVRLIASWIDSLSPRLSSIAPQSLFEDVPSNPISFTVGSLNRSPDSLVVSVLSSNRTLFPPAGISVTGDGASRQIVVTPGANQSGTGELIVQVKDAFNATASISFQVTVQPVNDPPSISSIPDQVTQESLATGLLTFSVNDLETPAGSLSLSATALDRDLVPADGFSFGGSGSVRTLKVTPARQRFGSTPVRVTVSDESLSTSTEFLLQVNSTTLVQTNAEFLEAEAGQRTLPAGVLFDPEASGGAYVRSTVAGQGGVEFPVLALTLGDYAVWARVWVTDRSIAAFGVKLDAGQEDIFDLPAVADSVGRWRWIALNGRGGLQPFTLNPRLLRLSPGSHKLRFRPLSTQVRLDRILYSPDRTFVPNDPPQAGSLSLATAEDTPLEFSLPGKDPEGRNVLYHILTGPRHGRLNGNAPQLTFIPDPDYSGSDSFSYWVNDGQLDSEVATVGLQISPVNDPPSVSVIEDQVGTEDTAFRIPFRISDAETGADDLQLELVSDTESPIPTSNLRLEGAGEERWIVGTPLPEQNGTTQITLIAIDRGGARTLRAFKINLVAVNDPPRITTIADQALREDASAIQLGFQVEDVETLAQNLQVAVFSSPRELFLNGELTASGEGNFRVLSLRPAKDMFGEAAITLEVADTQGGVARTTFRVTVNPVNDPPTLLALNDLVMDQNSVGGPVQLELADLETPADRLRLDVWSANPRLIPNSGLQLAGSGATRTLNVVPVLGRFGEAEIYVRVRDEEGANQIRRMKCRVLSTASGFSPSISRIENQVLLEDTASEPLRFTVQDASTPSEELSVTGVAGDSTLVADSGILIEGVGAERTVTITPRANATGTTTVFLTTRNREDGLALMSFDVTIEPVNDGPEVIGLHDITLREDESSEVMALRLQDVDGGAEEVPTLRVEASDPELFPTTGLLLDGLGTQRTLQLIPAPNRHGSATITLLMSDREGAFTSARFVATVLPVNDPPTLTAIEDQITQEDTPVPPITIRVTDRESEAADIQLSAICNDPTLVSEAGLEFSQTEAGRLLWIRPLPDRSGSASITVTAQDPDGGTTSLSFLLTVQAVDDAPRVDVVTEVSAALGTPLAGVEVRVSDLESGPETLRLSATSSNPALIPPDGVHLEGTGGVRTLLLTPLPERFGESRLSLRVEDREGQFSVTELLVTITHPLGLRPPRILGLHDLALREDESIVLEPIQIETFETPISQVQVEAQTEQPILLPQAGLELTGTERDRALRVTPASNLSGVGHVLFVVVEPTGGVASQRLRVTVQDVNDPPTIRMPSSIDVDEDSTSEPFLIQLTDDGGVAQFLVMRWVSETPDLLASSAIAFSPGNGGVQAVVTPNPNANGVGLLTLTVTDVEGAVSSQVLRVNVRPMNDLPSFGNFPDAIVTREDTTSAQMLIPVADLETPVEDLQLRVESGDASLVDSLGLVLGGAGGTRTLAVTPRPNAHGATRLRIILRDAEGGEVDREVSLTVLAVNDPPVLPALPEVHLSMQDPGSPIRFSVADLESPPDDIQITVRSGNPILLPADRIQIVSNGAERTLTLTPTPGLFGTAILLVEARDPDGESSVQECRVTVDHPNGNHPPEISAILDQSTAEDLPRDDIGVVVSDAESAAELLTVTAISSNPDLLPDDRIHITGLGANRVLSLVPVSNRSGSAQLLVLAQDPDGGVGISRFQFTVKPINDPPSLEPLADLVVNEDEAIPRIPLLLGDIETAAADLLVMASSSDAAVLTPARLIIEGTGALRSLLILPGTNQFGMVDIGIQVEDGQGGVTKRTFNLKIQPVNDPPTIGELAPLTIPEDSFVEGVEFAVADVDSPLDQLGVEIICDRPELLPKSGVSVAGSGSTRRISLAPAADQFGVARVTIRVTDPSGGTAESQFPLTVTEVNDPPEIGFLENVEGLEDQVGLSVPLVLADRDGLPASLRVVARSSNPQLIPDGNILATGTGFERRLNLAPAPDQSGTARIFVNVFDGNGDLGTSFFDLTIKPVNDPPTMDPLKDLNLPFLSPSVRLPLTGLGTGALNESQSVVITAVSDNRSLLPDPEISFFPGENRASLQLSPVAGEGGEARVTLTLRDDGGIDFGGKDTTIRSFKIIIEKLPRLKAVRSLRPALVLSWPDWASDFVLETRKLSETAWSRVPDRVVKVGGEFRVQLDFELPSRVYRLTRP